MTAPVWITGVQGFIGRALAQVLTKQGVHVVGFGRCDQDNTHTLSRRGLDTALRQHGAPARVFHLAGGATVGQSLADPHSDYISNVSTTELVLEALRSLSPVPFVLSSSAAVYGVGHDGPIHCDAQLRPKSPYGHHKVMAETLARSHAQAFGTPVTICRLFSIYGAGLRKQLMFDACSRLATLGPAGTLELGGTGAEQRDWLHVSDAAFGLASLGDPALGEVRLYNLASGTPTAIRDVAGVLVDTWGEGHSVTFSGETRVGDPFSLKAAYSSLPPGFTPKITLGDGLADLVTWFRAEVGKT